MIIIMIIKLSLTKSSPIEMEPKEILVGDLMIFLGQDMTYEFILTKVDWIHVSYPKIQYAHEELCYAWSLLRFVIISLLLIFNPVRIWGSVPVRIWESNFLVHPK